LQQVEDVTAIHARRFAELTISGAVPPRAIFIEPEQQNNRP
jgi:hypothetical protein